MSTVLYDGVSRAYPGSDRPAVDRLDLQIGDGECVVLVGPSGCGKSTSLRMLAGLEDVDAGTITIGDRDVTHLAPKDRDIAMVFQNYALYPHMSVADNIGFALKVAGIGKAERMRRVREAATMLDLQELLDRKPRALSGGQRQRVAMGRAIVREPQVFLMDEPLSNLDAKLRVSTRSQIAALQRRLGITTIYVTHDQVEAMTMGDRVAVLNGGVLQQVDIPRRLYDKPANVFVAGFVGSPAMNLIRVPVVPDGVRLGDHVVPLDRATFARIGHNLEVILGIRPESVRATTQDGPELHVRVDLVEELGADAYLYGTATLGPDHQTDIVARIDPRSTPATNAMMRLTVDSKQVHVFSASSGQRLSS